jgi:hypothetical protein
LNWKANKEFLIPITDASKSEKFLHRLKEISSKAIRTIIGNG